MPDPITTITGMTPTEREEHIRAYVRLPEDARVMLTRDQARILRGLRQTYPQHHECTGYAALVLAIARYRRLMDLARRDPSVARRADLRLAVAQARRIQHPEGRLSRLYRTRYHEIVHALVTQGVSIRSAAEYLRRHHHFRVSHYYLGQLYRARLDTLRRIESQQAGSEQAGKIRTGTIGQPGKEIGSGRKPQTAHRAKASGRRAAGQNGRGD